VNTQFRIFASQFRIVARNNRASRGQSAVRSPRFRKVWILK